MISMISTFCTKERGCPGPVQISPLNEKEITTMIIRDAKGIIAEVHLYDNATGLDFVEEFLDAGFFDRDAEGACLVEDVHYIDDYATDACNGSNPDFEEPLDAKWDFKEV